MSAHKTIIASYALIGAAVATSLIYNKMLERDAKRFTKKMAQDMDDLKANIANLGK
jgi:hypothetical protein